MNVLMCDVCKKIDGYIANFDDCRTGNLPPRWTTLRGYTQPFEIGLKPVHFEKTLCDSCAAKVFIALQPVESAKNTC